MTPLRPRYKLTMSYKGTVFYGWQKQPRPDQPSVQGELEGVLKTIFQNDIRVIGSGRTDRGVHALAQTAHFDLQTPLTEQDAKDLLHKLNRLSPPELFCYKLEQSPPKFHAQLWTVQKTYKYVLSSARFPHPLWGDLVATTPAALDLGRLNLGAQVFLGTHDFKSMQTSGTKVPHTTRTLVTSEWQQSGDLWVYTITGDGFLKQMVRNIVGTLLSWSEGDEGPESLQALLAAKDRSLAGPCADPHGLYLWKVEYGDPIDSKCRTLASLPFTHPPFP